MRFNWPFRPPGWRAAAPTGPGVAATTKFLFGLPKCRGFATRKSRFRDKKFPVIFPDRRELGVETGSNQTASATALDAHRRKPRQAREQDSRCIGPRQWTRHKTNRPVSSVALAERCEASRQAGRPSANFCASRHRECDGGGRWGALEQTGGSIIGSENEEVNHDFNCTRQRAGHRHQQFHLPTMVSPGS